MDLPWRHSWSPLIYRYLEDCEQLMGRVWPKHSFKQFNPQSREHAVRLSCLCFANLNDFLHYNGQISEYSISLPLRKGTCVFSTINTIFKENTFYAKGKLTKAYFRSNSWVRSTNECYAGVWSIENDTISEGMFLPSCPDCTTISFISQFKNETIKTLYFFSKSQNP